MRFFKAFSLLHRRTKSDSAIVQDVPKAYVRPLSFTAGQSDRQVLSDNDPFGAFVSFNSPTTQAFIPLVTSAPPAADRSSLVILDTRLRHLESENAELKSTNKTPAVLCERIHVLEAEIAELKRRSLSLALTTRIDELELEKRQLNSTIQVLLTTVTELNEDATKTRCDLHDLHMHDIHLRRQAKEDEEEIERLEAKLAQYVKFIGMMVDIGLHEAVLSRACTALKAGEDADEALIDSIKEAAANPASPWSKIVPAVTGPRTSDEYLSAIGLTLKLRREVKDSKKVTKFWKRIAKEASDHAHIFTPSVSNISSIREQLGEERQTAVDDLLLQLRSGNYPRRLKRNSHLDSEPETSKAVDVVNTRPSSLVLSSVSDLSTIRQQSITICDTVSTSRDSLCTVRGPYVPNLAPLASDSFKEELATSHLYKHVVTSTTKQQSRVVLGELDRNRQVNKASLPTSNSTTSQGSKRSAKTLEKRHGMLVTESLRTIQAAYTPASRASPLAHSPTKAPSTDPFAEALSKALLAINQERQQKPDPCRISSDGATFDNSSFSRLVPSVTGDPYTEPWATFNTPSGSGCFKETDQNDITVRSLGKISEESGSCGISTSGSLDHINATENGNDGSDRPHCSDTTLASPHPGVEENHADDHLSFVNEPTTLEQVIDISTDATSPSKSSETTTPVKKSRLPVIKHFRRLSMSPMEVKAAKSPRSQKSLAVIKPPVSVKKMTKAESKKQPIVSRPSPLKATQGNPKSPSRLPMFATGAANSRIADSGRKAVRRLSQIIS